MDDLPTHNSPHDDVLARAVQAARRGTALIRDRTGQLGRMRAKQTNDFVTEVDEAAQDTILDVLLDGDDDIGVLAEEDDEDAGHDIHVDGTRWIVDPIDGTTNFIQQVPPYAVSIALQGEDEIVVGVVLDVPHDELFTAVAGHGAQLNGTPIQRADTDDFGDAFLATGFPYRRFEHTDQYLDVLDTILRTSRSVRRHGSASVDLARLACGRFDGFFETGLRPWDVAAGVLLVREAGGRVTDYRDTGGLTPVFERQVCATNGRIHRTLLDRLASMQDVRL
ncbi:MAG: inositol monophosphatase [Bacteroidetes bacterium SW_9_63_38]|nr:MAG: inositol monophosphatase [Bacteroidetes bacterium SW_9_63_38]